MKFWLHNSPLCSCKGNRSKLRGFLQRICKGVASWLGLTLPWSSDMTKAQSRTGEHKVSRHVEAAGKLRRRWGRRSDIQHVCAPALKAVAERKGQTGLEQQEETWLMEGEMDTVDGHEKQGLKEKRKTLWWAKKIARQIERQLRKVGVLVSYRLFTCSTC